ncbi:MAG: hypothetical protein PHF74_05405 [Dehalococcoidales bacterium]|nr:hypothetical protein [Dehalococcoidales bacterium]
MKDNKEKIAINEEVKQSGEISRRDFLIGTSAVMVSGAIGAGVLSGCGGGTETSLEIFNPVGDLATPIVPPAPRLDTLEGKKIAFYVARRANSFELIARLMEKLKAQFPTTEFVGGVEGTVWAKPTYDRSAKDQGIWDALMAENVDGIIMALSS